MSQKNYQKAKSYLYNMAEYSQFLQKIKQIKSSKITKTNKYRIKKFEIWINNTVKAFVVTPEMTKNSIIFRGGYDKGYKIFIAEEILFIFILIYLLLS